MSLFIYKWDQSDNTGETGWISKLHPNFDPSDARLMVHDCLEHLPRGQKHGGGEDELMAIGARAWLRIESGWVYSQGFFKADPMDIWADEVVRIARDCDLRCLTMINPVEPQEDWEECELILANCIPLIPEKLIQEDAISEDDEPYTADDPALLNALYWMRRGVRAAIKRFKGHSPDSVMWLAEQMERALKNYERGNDGDELHVRVHEKDLEFKVNHKSLYN